MVLQTELKKVVLQNNEQIAYRERDGGDKIVVLVHGNMTSSKHWDVLIDNMDPKYKIYALDMRGFGESTYFERVTTYETSRKTCTVSSKRWG